MSQDSMTVMVMTHSHGMRTYHLPYWLLHVFCLLTVVFLTVVSMVLVDYQESKHNVVMYEAANKHLEKAVTVIDERFSEDMVRLRTINLVMRRLNNYNETLMNMAGLPASNLNEEDVVGLGGPVGMVAQPVELSLSTDPEVSKPEELEDIVFSQEKSFIYLKSFLEQQSEQLSATPSIKPVVGSVFLSSHFGYRLSPFSKRRQFHSGVDLSGRRGMVIIATADGVVTKAGWQKGYGKLVSINHGFGYATRYGHNQKLLVKKGDKVKRGDKIALMGSTGYSTGPHSHYEVIYKKRSMNPMNYILNW